MKKFRIASLFLALVMVCCIFSGCTNADSATVGTINSKFKDDVKKYLWTSSDIASAIISKKDNDNYYFSLGTVDESCTTDNENLKQKINNSKDDELFSKLKNDKEYAELLNHASKYFFNNFTSGAISAFETEYSKIPQEKLTQLYKDVEAVLKDIKEFGEDYRELSADYFGSQTDELLGVKDDLETLLKRYKDLIGSVLDMNLSTLDIVDNTLYNFKDLTADGAEIPNTEIFRLVDAFELYITEYLYQRYMIYGDKLNVNFMNNALLKKMEELVNKCNELTSNKNIENTEEKARKLAKEKWPEILASLEGKIDASIYQTLVSSCEPVTTSSGKLIIKIKTEISSEYFLDFANNIKSAISQVLIGISDYAMVTPEQAVDYELKKNKNFTTYEYLRLVESTMKSTIEKNRNSAQALKSGMSTDVNSEDYNYKNAIYDDFTNYENTLLDCVKKIDLLLGAIA